MMLFIIGIILYFSSGICFNVFAQYAINRSYKVSFNAFRVIFIVGMLLYLSGILLSVIGVVKMILIAVL